MVNIVQGDYGSDLNFTITDADDSALDLTSATGIIFRMINITGKNVTVSGSVTTDVAANGTCHYSLVDGDTDEIGTYNFEVEVSFAGSVVTSKGAETIVIAKQLD